MAPGGKTRGPRLRGRIRRLTNVQPATGRQTILAGARGPCAHLVDEFSWRCLIEFGELPEPRSDEGQFAALELTQNRVCNVKCLLEIAEAQPPEHSAHSEWTRPMIHAADLPRHGSTPEGRRIQRRGEELDAGGKNLAN